MKEDFLHYIWKFGLFDTAGLRAASGERIEVVKPGEHNFDSGPDFFNAQIKINDRLWAGNVEVHIKSSDWNKHKHQSDPAYNNVILHVVLENDADNHQLHVQAKTLAGERIPEIELKFRIHPHVLKNYEQLKSSSKKFPCAGSVKNVDPLISAGWLERMAIERLEEKTALLDQSYNKLGKSWPDLFYHVLSKNLGFKTNAEPFENLANCLPLKLLSKHSNDVFQLEALMFGQSGMLGEQLPETYVLKLQNEYEFLRKKYQIIPMNGVQWKFSKMRPVNFPTIRIAQLASLLHRNMNLASSVFESNSTSEIKSLFNVSASAFWDTHYSFTSSSPKAIKKLGEDAIDNILINTVVPILFFYGKQKGENKFIYKALELLNEIEPEDNKIVREYEVCGLKVINATDTQGLLNMKKNYCSVSGCLSCGIGSNLLKKN